MLHWVNFKMALTCFMSPEGGGADGLARWCAESQPRSRGSGISKHTCDMQSWSYLHVAPSFSLSLLSEHAPGARSGSVSQLSLQPCDLISLTDCGCLGKVSLSTLLFLLRFTLRVTNSFWHPFEKQRSLLDSLRGLFTLTHKPTQKD